MLTCAVTISRGNHVAHLCLWMMFAGCVYKLFQTQVHGRGRAVALCIALWTCIELWMMFGDCVYELFQTQVHDVGGWGAHLREVSTVCVSPVWVGPLLAQTAFTNCFKLQKLKHCFERFKQTPPVFTSHLDDVKSQID